MCTDATHRQTKMYAIKSCPMSPMPGAAPGSVCGWPIKKWCGHSYPMRIFHSSRVWILTYFTRIGTRASKSTFSVPDTRFIWVFGSTLAWMPDELSPAHNIFGGEVRSGIAPLGRKLCPNRSCSDQIKLSGRALYDDGQMINSNVINHVTKERLGWIRFQQTWLPLESWDV